MHSGRWADLLPQPCTEASSLGVSQSRSGHQVMSCEKCHWGRCMWVTLCLCASRSAPWRRRRAFCQTPCTSSTPSAGRPPARWCTAWPARPPWCDPRHIGPRWGLALSFANSGRWLQSSSPGVCLMRGDRAQEGAKGMEELQEIKNRVISQHVSWSSPPQESTHFFFKPRWQYSTFSLCLNRGVWWTFFGWS